MNIDRTLRTDSEKEKIYQKAAEIVKSLEGCSYKESIMSLEYATAEIEYRVKALLDDSTVKNTKNIILNT